MIENMMKIASCKKKQVDIELMWSYLFEIEGKILFPYRYSWQCILGATKIFAVDDV